MRFRWHKATSASTTAETSVFADSSTPTTTAAGLQKEMRPKNEDDS